MMADINELAVNMAAIAERYLDTVDVMDRKAEGYTFTEYDAGRLTGQIDKLIQAAAEIMAGIDSFGIHTNYIDAVQLKLELCAPSLDIQTTTDPQEVDMRIDAGDGFGRPQFIEEGS